MPRVTEPPKRLGLTNILNALAALSVIVAASVFAWTTIQGSRHRGVVDFAQRPHDARPMPPLPTAPVSIASAPMLGNRAARVAIVEFGDFRCPLSMHFRDSTLKLLKATYIDSGKAVFAFREFPREIVHPGALDAARRAECAGEQGRFWEAHDELFAEPFEKTGTAAGPMLDHLDPQQLSQCISAKTTTERIAASTQEASNLGFARTPAFIVGTVESTGVIPVKRLSGPTSFQDLERAIIATENAEISDQGARK